LPQPAYPPARRGDDADDYHGELIRDPYRWLEETGSPETKAWIAAENELTEAFLAAVPEREPIRARLTELWDHPQFGVPFERGGRWFQFRNSGLQNQAVLYLMDAPDAEGRVLLDPNLLSGDGTVAVSATEVTDDGSLLAYATSAAGSDWQTWRVRDVATGTDREDVIEWSKWSRAAWRKDGSGFYYGALEPPEPGTEYLTENRLLRVLFHRLGTSQADDEPVYAAPDQPDWLPEASVSDDGRFVIIAIEHGTSPEAQLHVLDLDQPDAGLRPLVGEFAARVAVVTNVGTTFYLVTDYDADLRRLVAIDLDRPGLAKSAEVIPEAADTLLAARFCGGRLVCHYLRHAQSELRVHALDGMYIRDIPVPGIASLEAPLGDSGIEGRPGSDLLHFKITSFTEPGALWAHDLGTGETRLVRATTAGIDPAGYVTEQVFVTSDDGTQVPVFLSRRRDLEPTGEVPALLYGYGGFDVPITPRFSVAHAVWMERGGLLAIADLRGGGEYGRAWFEAGRRDRKQNVFDDFCACARWLAASGWSRAGRTGINGASNGGLLVGACLTQHPELFGAAVPEVGVLDMLRFHKFTIGWAWTGDVGDPDDPAEYPWLRSYSPLHRIRPGERYPATLLMTSDHDDRVVPGHSFKFAAALQAAQGGDEPILIRVETSAGHGFGTPTAKMIAERTDVLTFLTAALRPG
jgi:prolyl oligopeptidase